MKSFNDMVHKYERNIPAFSDFLGLAEISDFYLFLKDYPNLPYELFGGAPECERKILKIGNAETLGYDLPFPIKLIEISPKNSRFADELTHRDFLGALMNLGIERDTLGDILIRDNKAFLFCEENMAPFILSNLSRVRHTTVVCKAVEELPPIPATEYEEKLVQVASMRLDLVISKAYNLSRTASSELFRTGRIFVDGRLCENSSHELKSGQLVSVRGFGRLEIKEIKGLSRKGKTNLILNITK